MGRRVEFACAVCVPLKARVRHSGRRSARTHARLAQPQPYNCALVLFLTFSAHITTHLGYYYLHFNIIELSFREIELCAQVYIATESLNGALISKYKASGHPYQHFHFLRSIASEHLRENDQTAEQKVKSHSPHAR